MLIRTPIGYRVNFSWFASHGPLPFLYICLYFILQLPYLTVNHRYNDYWKPSSFKYKCPWFNCSGFDEVFIYFLGSYQNQSNKTKHDKFANPTF